MNWQALEATVQLGVGLNFASAGLELILQRPLITISEAQQKIIERARAAVTGGQAKSGLRAGEFHKLQSSLELVKVAQSFLCLANPYLSALSGCIALAILIGIAFTPETVTVDVQLASLVIVASVGWFTVVLLAMTYIRGSVGLTISPLVKKAGVTSI